MKRTRSPSGNGPDHPKPPRKHTEYKSDRRKLPAQHQNPSSAAKFVLFQQHATVLALYRSTGDARVLEPKLRNWLNGRDG